MTDYISIHAPHARSDYERSACYRECFNFNPRSSCEERLDHTVINDQIGIFQSTLLMRGATGNLASGSDVTWISIHAPHARSDCRLSPCPAEAGYFNPRSSCEERRPSCTRVEVQETISIHAPHARSDLFSSFQILRKLIHFNPRSSCEERQSLFALSPYPLNFNPRSSCEERQVLSFPQCIDFRISIHAPHARSDQIDEQVKQAITQFQSTLLMRGATEGEPGIDDVQEFQSTLLMRGATTRIPSSSRSSSYFNPRSSCEERRMRKGARMRR